MFPREQKRLDQIIDKQDVAHLFAVAVNSGPPFFESVDQKMRNPTLIFGAELVQAVNAAHPENHSG